MRIPNADSSTTKNASLVRALSATVYPRASWGAIVASVPKLEGAYRNQPCTAPPSTCTPWLGSSVASHVPSLRLAMCTSTVPTARAPGGRQVARTLLYLPYPTVHNTLDGTQPRPLRTGHSTPLSARVVQYRYATAHRRCCTGTAGHQLNDAITERVSANDTFAYYATCFCVLCSACSLDELWDTARQ